MKRIIARYIKEQDAATAIEYGMIVAMISLVVGVVAIALGVELDTTFNAYLGFLTTANS